MQIWSCQVREGPQHPWQGGSGKSGKFQVVRPVRFGKLGFVAFSLGLGWLGRATKLGASFLPSFPWSLPQAAIEEWALALSRALFLLFPHNGQESGCFFDCPVRDTLVIWRMRVLRRIMHAALTAGRFIVPRLISGAEPGKLLSVYKWNFLSVA